MARRRCHLFLASLTLAMSSLGWAHANWVGMTLVAARPLRLQQSLPVGLYCNDGQVLATIGARERVRVLATARVNCALVLGRDYIEVERLGPGIPDNLRRGYVRDPNAASFQNLPQRD